MQIATPAFFCAFGLRSPLPFPLKGISWNFGAIGGGLDYETQLNKALNAGRSPLRARVGFRAFTLPLKGNWLVLQGNLWWLACEAQLNKTLNAS
jgi:hypothetical protein